MDEYVNSIKKDDSLKCKKEQEQDTGKFRKNTKEQFYTNVNVAKSCIKCIIDIIPNSSEYLWIEPSAGNGAFLHNIPSTFEKIGIDIDPMGDTIIKQDYLKWIPPLNKNILIFGNPPFGRQSSIAKSFIIRGCEYAKIIAFILPKSFTKPSMFNVFNLKFHLIHSIELEKNAFVLNGSKYDVPCVFQIWKKMDVNRIVDVKVLPDGFTYVKRDSVYDVAFRRVGGLAGKCYLNSETEYSIQSHYFIKFDDNLNTHKTDIIIKINAHIFPSNTVGPRSLSKQEVNVVLNSIIQAVSA